MYNEVVINTQGDTMFHDLKKAFKKVQENLLIEYVEDGDDEYIIDESSWREFEREFKICFVEPEDDEEWELWVESDDVV